MKPLSPKGSALTVGGQHAGEGPVAGADPRPAGRPTSRWRCGGASGAWCASEPSCPRRSFTQTTAEIPPRSRLTARLRQRLAEAVARSNRAVSEVAAEYGVSWRTVHRAFIVACADWLPRAGADPGAGHRRDPGPHGAVDPAGRGLAAQRSVDDLVRQRRHHRPGSAARPGAGPVRGCVRTWLGEQTPQFRAGIELVVIDPSAPYASGIRAALPHARIAVDHWHLVRLANDMLTEVRQRVTR